MRFICWLIGHKWEETDDPFTHCVRCFTFRGRRRTPPASFEQR